jgi:hypothetical protein
MASKPRLHAVNDGAWIGEPDSPPTPPGTSTNSASGGPNPPNSGNSGRPQKTRADRGLPTDRLAFEKQVDVLRAIAQMSGSSRRPVTAEDLSAAAGLKGSTGGLSNRFFRDSGWVVSAGRGMYTATDPLLEYHRHLNIDAQDLQGARRHLAASAQASWYWEELEPLLNGSARQSMILHALSKAAGAYEHTPQLVLILTWLEWLGLIRREGDIIFRGSVAADPAQPEEGTREDEPVKDADTSGQAPHEAVSASDQALTEECETPPAPGDSSTPVPDTSALVSFNFSVRITADDAAKLDAEQLKALLEFAEKLRG